MSEEAMSKALDAIHDQAVKLLKFNLPDEVNRGLESIIALARYKFDVRTQEDRQSTEEKA